MGFWGWFYLIAVILTLFHSVVPATPLRGRQHALGAEIIAMSWLCSYFARAATNDATPLVAYAFIDAMTAWGFLFIAIRRKAIWASLCVILHAMMGALHLAFFAVGQGKDGDYIFALNGLFLSALLIINVAIFAGRHEWGSKLDSWLVHRAGGWTFSGLRVSRGAHHRGQA